jgi:hypothetical protein
LSIDVLLSRLDKVRRTGPETWLASCPAHDDRQPSMTIRETGDGLILLHCFGGCGIDEILLTLDMDIADLFPARPESLQSKPLRHRFPARDVLECVANEALITAIVAAAIAAGKVIPRPDLARCQLANVRIHEAIDALG